MNNASPSADIVEPEDLSPTITVAGIEFVLIPAGEFTMGSDEGEDNEKPPHKVYLDAFYIGKYPITNAQYRPFVEATGHEAPRHWSSGSIPKGKENHPVVYMRSYDASRYCQWLASETGRAVRLQTEAQWEKAARGTDGRRYPWGDEFDESKCNTIESGIGDTTPVGKYSPQGDSPYDVADMAGNVCERTTSLREDYPYPAHDGREDQESRDPRVVRGGSFYESPSNARCAYRYYARGPDYANYELGFRVVVSPGSPE